MLRSRRETRRSSGSARRRYSLALGLFDRFSQVCIICIERERERGAQAVQGEGILVLQVQLIGLVRCVLYVQRQREIERGAQAVEGEGILLLQVQLIGLVRCVLYVQRQRERERSSGSGRRRYSLALGLFDRFSQVCIICIEREREKSSGSARRRYSLALGLFDRFSQVCIICIYKERERGAQAVQGEGILLLQVQFIGLVRCILYVQREREREKKAQAVQGEGTLLSLSIYIYTYNIHLTKPIN